MPITLGDTSITGLGVGGLPDGTINAADLANGAVTPAKTSVGKLIKQMKSAQLNTDFLTSANGNITALSLTFDNAVTVGNQILVMASGSIVAGSAADNWGAGADLFIDSTCITSNQASTGSGNYIWQGAIDNNSDGGWGQGFGMKAIGTAGSTNPTISLRVNRQLDWSWVAVGYTGTTYGKCSTNLVAIEFGV